MEVCAVTYRSLTDFGERDHMLDSFIELHQVMGTKAATGFRPSSAMFLAKIPSRAVQHPKMS